MRFRNRIVNLLGIGVGVECLSNLGLVDDRLGCGGGVGDVCLLH